MPGFYPIGGAPIAGLEFPEETISFIGTATTTARGYVGGSGFIIDRPGIVNDDGHILTDVSLGDSANFVDVIKCGYEGDETFAPFFRFPLVPIPEGSDIDAVYIILTAANTIDYNTDVVITAEDIKFSPAVSTTSPLSDLVSRSRTSTSVSWSIPAVVPGDKVTTPDLSGIVQELVDRSDWLDPNAHAIMFFLDPVS